MHKRQKIIFMSTLCIATLALASAVVFSNVPKGYSEDTTKEGFVNNLMTNVSLGLEGNTSRQ